MLYACIYSLALAGMGTSYINLHVCQQIAVTADCCWIRGESEPEILKQKLRAEKG